MFPAGLPALRVGLASLGVVFVACFAAARPAVGQTVGDRAQLPARVVESGTPIGLADNLVDWERRFAELRQWIEEYRAWKAWADQWLGRRQPGWLGAQSRRDRPNPPDWLAEECRNLVAGEGTLFDACVLFSDWAEDYASSQLRLERTTARAQGEVETKSQWWERVHVDLFWPMTQLRSTVYGVVGMHATMEVGGRLQVFVAPGVMLINVPTQSGTREWKPATDWGFSYRLFDFRFPGTERLATMHVNVAKAWVFAGPSNLFKTNIDLAGFSMTLKQTPRH
jgi:hypothetical protein